MRAWAWGLRNVWPSMPAALQVARVGELAEHLGRPVRPGAASPIPPEVGFAPSTSCAGRRQDGIEDLLVAGAAAQVARERLPDLVVRGARVVVEQVDGRNDQARACRTRTARRRGEERLLDRVQRPPSGDASTVTTSARRPARRGRGTSRRGRRRATPSTNRTRPARRRSWSRRGRGSRRRKEKALAGPDVCLAGLAVDGEGDLHARHHSSARRVMTREHGGDRRPCRARRRWARGRRDERREALRILDRRRHEPHRRRRRPEGRTKLAPVAIDLEGERATEITIAFRGPTFMKVWAEPLGRTRTATTISSGSSAFCLTPSRKSPAAGAARPGRSRPGGRRPPGAGAGVRRRPARRSRGCRRSCTVADLRRADRTRGLRQGGRRSASSPSCLGIRDARSQADVPFSRRESTQLLHRVEVDQGRGASGRS